MFISLKALKQFLDTNASVDNIVNTLISIGIEVESINDNISKYKNFIVGFVEDCVKHPDSTKLNICNVNTGSSVLQVICGASNVRKGLKVAFAKEGAIVPNGGFQIKKAKIRGVESCGMICSAEELALQDEDTGGILELDSSASLGQDLAEYLGLDDVIIEISITPNRGDWASVYGVARDLAAKGLGRLIEQQISVPAVAESVKDVKINVSTDKCLKFCGLVIEGVQNISSPDYITRFLKSVGLNSKGILVDVTNYVMFMFGRPMHAYDLDKLGSSLTICDASENQSFVSLLGGDVPVPCGSVLIKNLDNIAALGGVMGGKNTAVDDKTQAILLESAVFDKDLIVKTTQQTGIKTDSSYRFERGTDADFVEKSIYLVVEILKKHFPDLKIGKLYKHEQALVKNIINFNYQNVQKLTGLQIEQVECDNILQKLGFIRRENGFEVPSWRHDCFLEQDLVEEIIRIRGYDLIPLQPLEPKIGIKNTNLAMVNKIKNRLSDNKLLELVNYSFVSRAYNEFFSGLDFYGSDNDIGLKNPISADLGVMRRSLVPSLLDICAKNIAKDSKNLSFFEIGNIYGLKDNLVVENAMIGVVRTGLAVKKTHFAPERPFDIFDIKADLEVVCKDMNLDKFVFEPFNHPSFHPKRSFVLTYKNTKIGILGQLHPLTLERVFDIKQDVFVLELVLDKIISAKPQKTSISANIFQPVKRDIAFIIDANTPYKSVCEIAKREPMVINVDLLDIFTDETRLGVNKKSVAIEITIQPENQTLTREIIDNQIIKNIIHNIKTELAAVVRDGKESN